MMREFPRQLPPFSALVADIGASSERLAERLGVSLRTVQRWHAGDQAPRPVLVALFLMSRWGRSVDSIQALNQAATYAGMAAMYRREMERLRLELARVVAAGEFGSANAPTVRDLAPRLGLVAAPALGDPFAQARELADQQRADDGATDDKQALA